MKTYKYQLKNNSNYKVTESGCIVNTKTGRTIKETVLGYTKGYWIGRKFISTEKVRSSCELIEKLSLKKLKEIYPNMF